MNTNINIIMENKKHKYNTRYQYNIIKKENEQNEQISIEKNNEMKKLLSDYSNFCCSCQSMEDKKNKIRKILEYIDININHFNNYESFKNAIRNKLVIWKYGECKDENEIGNEYFYLLYKF